MERGFFGRRDRFLARLHLTLPVFSHLLHRIFYRCRLDEKPAHFETHKEISNVGA